MQKSHSNGFSTLESFYIPPSNEFLIQAVPEGNLKLDEMITLGLLKRSSLTGPIKKMLHAPTQKLFAVKEVPLSSREVRHLLKQWLNRWEGLSKHEHFVEIFDTKWLTPEGCVSIICEFMNAGSLQDLLDTVGAVPENCLKEIAHQVLRGLDYLGVPHNCVSSTQILFNKEARVKISLGIRSISHPPPEQPSGSMA